MKVVLLLIVLLVVSLAICEDYSEDCMDCTKHKKCAYNDGKCYQYRSELGASPLPATAITWRTFYKCSEIESTGNARSLTPMRNDIQSSSGPEESENIVEAYNRYCIPCLDNGFVWMHTADAEGMCFKKAPSRDSRLISYVYRRDFCPEIYCARFGTDCAECLEHEKTCMFDKTTYLCIRKNNWERKRTFLSMQEECPQENLFHKELLCGKQMECSTCVSNQCSWDQYYSKCDSGSSFGGVTELGLCPPASFYALPEAGSAKATEGISAKAAEGPSNIQCGDWKTCTDCIDHGCEFEKYELVCSKAGGWQTTGTITKKEQCE